MKIALAQIDCSPGNIKTNLEKISHFTKRAKKAASEIVVFPEMVDTGYLMPIIQDTASYWDGAPLKFLQKTAKENQIGIICGISEREEDHIYNSMVVIDQQGNLIGKYRKTHLAAYPPLNENSTIAAGNSLELLNINGFTFGLMICYDLRFPEMSRSLTLKGADTLILVSAWPFPRLSHWETLIRARAIENQVYFVAANRVGKDGENTFCGSSRIVDPYGVIVASAAENREELIIGEINKETVLSVREQMPIFKHRQKNLYEIK